MMQGENLFVLEEKQYNVIFFHLQLSQEETI